MATSRAHTRSGGAHRDEEVKEQMSETIQRGLEQGQAFQQMLRRVVVALRLCVRRHQLREQCVALANRADAGPCALPGRCENVHDAV